MANYQILKADIDKKVYQNGGQEITGANLNSVLNSMVTTLGEEYQFAGVATTATNPGSPDAKVFYIANGKGTYTNFGGVEVTEDEVVVLYWDTAWHKETTGIASQAKLTELGQNFRDGAIFSPINAVSFSVDGNNVTITFRADSYSVYDKKFKKFQFSFSAEQSFTLVNYDALIFDFNTNSISISSYSESADNKFLLAYNEYGIIREGVLATHFLNEVLLKPYVSNEHIFGFVDVLPSLIKSKTWVDDTNTEYGGASFSIFEYSIVNAKNLAIYCATGGANAIFLDAENNVLDSFQTPLSDRYVSKWMALSVPNGATTLKVSQSIQSETHPQAYPLRVLMDNQNFMSINHTTKEWLYRKKVLFVGDSITDDHGSGFYVKEITDLTGCETFNRGWSGSTIATGYNSMCDRLELPANDGHAQSDNYLGFPTTVDFIFVLGGVNDWGRLRSQEFGTLQDAENKDSFCGALRFLYGGLRRRYPQAKIVILNLLHCYSPTDFPNFNEINYQNGDETQAFTIAQNNVGKTFYDYRKAISDAAKMYGFPCIDLFDVGFTATLTIDRTNYYMDGLHPNQAGGNLMARFILRQLESLMNN